MTVTRRDVLQASAATLLTGVATRTFAQATPYETVRIITGFPPGGTSDTICRRVASKLAPGYGKSVVVENRAGAGGQIAIQGMKQLPPDGTAILQTPMSMLGIYPHIYKKLQYDPIDRRDAGVARRDVRLRLRGRPRGAGVGAQHRRVPRLVQGQPDAGQLRVTRRRLGAALHRRADRPLGRRRPEARALPRHAAGDPRDDRRPDPVGVGAGGRIHAARGRRQDPAAGHQRRAAQQVRAHRADAGRARPQRHGLQRVVRLLSAGQGGARGGATRQRRVAHARWRRRMSSTASKSWAWSRSRRRRASWPRC